MSPFIIWLAPTSLYLWRGYYHNRPKSNVNITAPIKLNDGADADATMLPTRRSMFDDFQVAGLRSWRWNFFFGGSEADQLINYHFKKGRPVFCLKGPGFRFSVFGLVPLPRPNGIVSTTTPSSRPWQVSCQRRQQNRFQRGSETRTIWMKNCCHDLE